MQALDHGRCCAGDRQAAAGPDSCVAGLSSILDKHPSKQWPGVRSGNAEGIGDHRRNSLRQEVDCRYGS